MITSLRYTGTVRANPELLRRHVQFLTMETRPRGARNPEQLARAAAYIAESFRRSGGRVEMQPYDALGQTYANVMCLSSITVAELRYGAARRNSQRLHQLIDAFVTNVAVLAFDETCTSQFGELAAELNARGTPIGDFDVLIAAHAIAAEATLITNNVKHLARIGALKVEKWF